MKTKILRVFCLALALLMLAGCSTTEEAPKADTTPMDTGANQGQWDFDFDFDFGLDDFTIGIDPEYTNPPQGGNEPVVENADGYKLTYSNVVSSATDDVRYVMIYNPAVFNPNAMYNRTQSTGSFGNQVDVNVNRGGLDEIKENLTISQGEIDQGPVFQGEGDKAGTLGKVYKVGDQKQFYCASEDNINVRMVRNFTCKYAGTYCNIWVAGVNLSNSVVNYYGQEFDKNVYQTMTREFGTSRFAENGSKVNFLYYPMPMSTGGFSCPLDSWASGEVSAAEIRQYGVNTDHALLHMNGYLADYQKYPANKNFMTSTLAHEFQHMICATDAFEKPTFVLCDIWFNEGMSGYIEEKLYPGVKAERGGHVECLMASDLIRNGQSLYNFKTGYNDIGVYGSVYLYSNYLAELAGDDVFSNFHQYWRASYDADLTVAEALVAAVPQDVYDSLYAAIPYPSGLSFANEEEEWMSKLTLSFYLELLDKEQDYPKDFDAVKSQYLLYDQINSTTLEGGGRVIVALSGNQYQIPGDADTGLIYVGLNKDFEVVTDLIYH